MGLGNIVVRSRPLPVSEASRPPRADAGRRRAAAGDRAAGPRGDSVQRQAGMVAGPAARSAQVIGVGADFERVLGVRPAQGR